MTDDEKESLYAEALELKDIKKYDEQLRAYKRFAELGDYKDSESLAKECKAFTDEADKFVGNIYGKRNKAKKTFLTLAIVAVVFIIGFTLYKTIITREINYKKAVALYEEGEYDKAREIFVKLGKYKESAAYLKESSQKTEIAVGNTIYFGSIEQDNDGNAEYIEWIILDIVDNKALLLTKYAIYNYLYDDEPNDSLWAECELRTWLNTDFVVKCFTHEERDRIVPTSVGGDLNPYYEKNFNEVNSWDQVFVLSASELVKYLDTAEKRMCYATPYAIYYGAVSNSVTNTTFYWTRTQGSTNNNVVSVDSSGEIFYAGSVKTSVRRAVRPAMWINIEGFVDQEHTNEGYEDYENPNKEDSDFIN